MKVTEHKVQLYLPRTLYRYLKSAAASKKASISGFIRALIRQEMSTGPRGEDDPLIAMIGKGRGTGPRDGSRHVDKYLYGER